MTFYDVTIYSSKLAGELSGTDNFWNALRAVTRGFESGTARNAPYCDECKSHGVPDEGAVYHLFLVRHDVLLDIIKGRKVYWRKKKGMGRATPEVFLQNPTQEFRDVEFQVGIWEI